MPPRIKHFVRTNPETHTTEFAFQFRDQDTAIGWWTLEQVVEASNAAVRVVTKRKFEAMIADQFPDRVRSDGTEP